MFFWIFLHLEFNLTQGLRRPCGPTAANDLGDPAADVADVSERGSDCALRAPTPVLPITCGDGSPPRGVFLIIDDDDRISLSSQLRQLRANSSCSCTDCWINESRISRAHEVFASPPVPRAA